MINGISHQHVLSYNPRNPLNPFIYKGLRGFNLFLGNFEGGQNRAIERNGLIKSVSSSYS